MKHALAGLFVLSAALAAGVTPAHAAWPKLPTDVFQVSPAGVYVDGGPIAASDGTGGMIVVWKRYIQNNTAFTYDLRATHVLASGTVDPAWPASGVQLCNAPIGQAKPAMVTDGAGGALVTWEDYRSGITVPDIYATHVSASGAIASGWPAGGVAICTAARDQLVPTIVSDGAGGAVIAWQDDRVFYDIYAQHLLASGAVDPAWPVDGRALCTATDGQGSQTMVSDGAGGAIVVWHDFRSHTNWDIYAQRVLASGVVDPAWPVDGRALSTAASHQDTPMAVTDGAGGAIVTWQDRRSGPFGVYAQHVFVSGAVDPAWTTDGVPVSVATTFPPANNAPEPHIVSDGAGGALISWQDDRTTGILSVYAHHLFASGLADPTWPANGSLIYSNSIVGSQPHPVILPDDAGGAIVCWQQRSNGIDDDLYAMRVSGSGVLDPAWYPLGCAVATRTGGQDSTCVVSDGHHGALLAYHDFYGITSAARVWSNGLLGPSAPVITSITDVPADQGGFVTLHWNASYYDPDPLHDYTVTQYSVWRMLPPAAQQAAARAGAGSYRATRSGTRTLYWEQVGTVAATGASTYQHTYSTFADSVSAPPPYVSFMVIAEAPTAYWASLADSGYSVDNFAPLPPQAVQSYFTGSQAQLHWLPSPAADLRGYRIYADLVPDFPTDIDHFVGQTSSTSFTQAAEIQFYYRVTAVDLHGNESASVLLTLAVLGVGDAPPVASLALYAPRPNPVSRSATLRFALPTAAPARLAVYDASGREVRRLVDGEMSSGEHDVSWDLLDGSGHGVGAGLYFVRLVVSEQTRVQRAVVTR